MAWGNYAYWGAAHGAIRRALDSGKAFFRLERGRKRNMVCVTAARAKRFSLVGLAAALGWFVRADAARAGEGGASPAMLAKFNFLEGEKAEKGSQYPKSVEFFEKALAVGKDWPTPEMRLSYARALLRIERNRDALREADAYLKDPKRSGRMDGEAERIRTEAASEKPSMSAQVESVYLDLGEGVTMKLNRIPAGNFVMGSPQTEQGRGKDEVQHLATISKPYYLGVYEVTQLQYMAVTGANPSSFAGLNNPVESVSWNDAAGFCDKLSAITGRNARLPTEAEWEYACRAGTATAYGTGDSLGPDQANYDRSGRGRTMPVGSFPANALGLFDMHGNVWEWCADWYGTYPEEAVKDPKGPESGLSRVLRGGSWRSGADGCRSAKRLRGDPGDRYGVGFRVALD